MPHRATPATAYAARPKATVGDRAADTHDRIRADIIGATGTVTLRHGGRLYQLGVGRVHGQSNVPLRVPGVSNAKAIAAGGSFSLAVVAGGRARAWGDNAFGQLGNGGAVTGPAPVTVTGLSGAARVAAGGVASLAFGPAATAPGPSGASAGQVGTAAGTANTAGPVGTVGAAAGPVSSPWRVAANPPDPGGIDGLKDVFFSSVGAGSASDAWAVGASDALSTSSQPLAEHWDGHAWHTVTVPMPAGATGAQLGGVDEVNSGDVWAVGTMTTSAGATRTLIEHFDGTAWAVVPSPNPRTGPGASDELRGIGGTSAGGRRILRWPELQCHAVRTLERHGLELHEGARGPACQCLRRGGDRHLANRCLGGGRERVANGHRVRAPERHGVVVRADAVPAGRERPAELPHRVTATGPGDVWASGYEGNVNQPYVPHRNGTAWSLTKTPNAGSEGSLLAGVTALSPTDVWVAGQTGESDGALLTFTSISTGRPGRMSRAWTRASSATRRTARSRRSRAPRRTPCSPWEAWRRRRFAASRPWPSGAARDKP